MAEEGRQKKDVHIRAQSGPTENVASGREGENPGGRPCDRGKGRTKHTREKLSAEGEREEGSARRGSERRERERSGIQLVS